MKGKIAVDIFKGSSRHLQWTLLCNVISTYYNSQLCSMPFTNSMRPNK